jgi:hypothetical protein
MKETKLDEVFGLRAGAEAEQLVQDLLIRTFTAIHRNADEALGGQMLDAGFIARVCEGLDYDSLAGLSNSPGTDGLMDFIVAAWTTFGEDPIGSDNERQEQVQGLAGWLERCGVKPTNGVWFADYMADLKSDKPDAGAARKSLYKGIRELAEYWALMALKDFAGILAPQVNLGLMDDLAAECVKRISSVSAAPPPGESGSQPAPALSVDLPAPEGSGGETPLPPAGGFANDDFPLGNTESEKQAREATEEEEEAIFAAWRAEEESNRLADLWEDLVTVPDLVRRLKGWLRGEPSGPYLTPRGMVRSGLGPVGWYVEHLADFSRCARGVRDSVMQDQAIMRDSPIRIRGVVDIMEKLITAIREEMIRIADPDWRTHSSRLARGERLLDLTDYRERLSKARVRPRALFRYAAGRSWCPDALKSKR